MNVHDSIANHELSFDDQLPPNTYFTYAEEPASFKESHADLDLLDLVDNAPISDSSSSSSYVPPLVPVSQFHPAANLQNSSTNHTATSSGPGNGPGSGLVSSKTGISKPMVSVVSKSTGPIGPTGHIGPSFQTNVKSGNNNYPPGPLLSLKNEEIAETFHALVVFATIQANDRINTQRKLHVYSGSDLFQGVWRFLTGENRYDNVKYVHNVFMKAFGFLEMALNQKEYYDAQDKLAFETNCQTRKLVDLKLANEQFIKRSIERIQNATQIFAMLGQTYKNQNEIIAHLNLLQTDIHDHLERINKTLQLTFQASGVSGVQGVVSGVSNNSGVSVSNTPKVSHVSSPSPSPHHLTK